jgi:hypothetical protein
MSGIVQKGKAYVGIAGQAAKGSAAADALFAHTLTGGKVIDVPVEQNADETTSGDRERSFAIRTGVSPSFGPWTAHAYMRSLGLYLLGIYGDVTDGGAPGAYTHTYGVGDELPYLTAWGRLDAEYQKVWDVKLSELGLSWDGPGPLELSVNGPACAVDANAAAWDLPGGPDDESGSDAFLIPTGGTFKIAAEGDAPATALITGGEIKISNELEPIPDSASLLPGLLAEKMLATEVTLKVVPEDLGLWRTILTGSASGTTPQETPAYGSFEITFVEHGSGTGTLALRAHKVAFMCDFPDVDPAGGHVELDLAGVCFKTSTYPGIVPVLTNAVAEYSAGAGS